MNTVSRLEKIEKKYPRIDLETNSEFRWRLACYLGMRKRDKMNEIANELRVGLVKDVGEEYISEKEKEYENKSFMIMRNGIKLAI